MDLEAGIAAAAREADACTKPGEIGALLRREGLYSLLRPASPEQRRWGELAGLRPKKRPLGLSRATCYRGLRPRGGPRPRIEVSAPARKRACNVSGIFRSDTLEP